MTPKPCFLLFLMLVSGLAKAQYETILNDPDVIWAAEIEMTFWIEPEFTAPDSVWNDRNVSTLLKLSNDAVNPGDESKVLLATRLLNLLLDEDKTAFAHPDSNRALTIAERAQIVNIMDTVTVVDPVTGMESNQLVSNAFSSESIQMMRVRQLLFYRDKTDEFELYTLAFAPLLIHNTGNAFLETYHRFAPFWFKMPPYRRKDTQHQILNNSNITWARRMRTGTNMPHLDSLRPFKDFKPPVMQQYINRLRGDAKFKVREGLDWEIIPPAARKEYCTKIDTMVTFDPDTYEEKLLIVRDDLSGQELMQLRLVEDWFWDERRKYPIFQLYAFAPMEDIRDNDGNFRFKRPIFWRLLRD
jgi:hypothetical protein